MKKQNYKNHKMYYPLHHFVFLPLMGTFIIFGLVKAMNAIHRLEWVLFSVLSFCILYLAIMLRQHYALGNQDRIVRLEFRLRYFELFKESSKRVEDKLSLSQLEALRFSDDLEFPALLERALKENISADEIKKSIQNWQADNMRV
jgi:Ca2+/Na+ antiporter